MVLNPILSLRSTPRITNDENKGILMVPRERNRNYKPGFVLPNYIHLYTTALYFSCFQWISLFLQTIVSILNTLGSVCSVVVALPVKLFTRH